MKDNLDKDGKLGEHCKSSIRFTKTFYTLNERDQSSLIRKSNEKMTHVLSTTKPTEFIPPYTLFNNDTFYALKENNITLITTNKSRPFPSQCQHSLKN